MAWRRTTRHDGGCGVSLYPLWQRRGPVAEDNEWGVKNALIPAGRCAVVRHHGSHDLLADCARALYRDWLPASGEELRDFPLFFHYHNFVHEVPTHELVTDIYLPLA